ncbi:hypothetical protein [Streptomyces spiramyceticus]|uniref:hypothetical protein n=1 Tax=Streptomyces spiramyceticus TaxID=299717 RepID=UPI00237B4893|nr:hypothetical protein [Streptomyces spiramyceticus]
MDTAGQSRLLSAQKGTPMYEMRAESTVGKAELIWHVISKEATDSTLCGRPVTLSSPAAPLPQNETTAERYCPSCMTAVSSGRRR